VDSADAVYNNSWRPARNRLDGLTDVLAGVRALLAARGPRSAPKVGLYAVITRLNIDAVPTVGALAAELGCDYFVPQPISLAADHPLHRELSLTPHDAPALRYALSQLYARQPVVLPAPAYPGQVIDTVTADKPGLVRGCFGGTDLFFIEPDGSVWDCPSALKIAATPPARYRSIRDASAVDLFGRAGACADCRLFSGDCVNMWPLMGFGRFLQPAGARS
jgi:MoaA/NifB/PqqE/SkfB family radical SAM enzyme